MVSGASGHQMNEYLFIISRQRVTRWNKYTLWTPVISWRSLPKPAIMGLSCEPFALWPWKLQRLLAATSWSLSPKGLPTPRSRDWDCCLGDPNCIVLGFPPRMAETEKWEERACFWMAEVIVIHSDMTNETGSTATDTGRLRYCILGISWCNDGDAGSTLWTGERGAIFAMHWVSANWRFTSN